MKVETNKSMRIDAKILSLLSSRRVISLSSNFFTEDTQFLWLNQVFDVQRKIYALDYFYENDDGLGSIEENKLWIQLLSCGKNLTSKSLEEFESHIFMLRQYANDEGELRSFEKINLSELELIAQRKSVDVSLARASIFSLSGAKKYYRLQKYFNYYDAALEIIEDFIDSPEDRLDWNLNLWLTPIRQGVSIEDAIFANTKAFFHIMYKMEFIWLDLSSKEKHLASSYRNHAFALASYLTKNTNQIGKFLSTMKWLPYDELVGINNVIHLGQNNDPYLTKELRVAVK